MRDFSYWLEHYRAIGKSEGYSKEQIEEYGRYLNLLIEHAKSLQAKG